MDKKIFLQELVLPVIDKIKSPLLRKDLIKEMNRFLEANKDLTDDQFIIKTEEQFGFIINTQNSFRNLKHLDSIDFMIAVSFILMLIGVVAALFKGCATM